MIIKYLDYLSTKKIVLASASPRRAEILTLLRLPFSVTVSTFVEDLPKASFSSAGDYAKANAVGKASEVASRAPASPSDVAPDVVIGSDTIVVLDGVIMEKPRSEGAAYEMLRSLSGRRHTVISAVAIFVGGKIAVEDAVETGVVFAELTEEEIWAYVKTGDPMDKAGAYGIQSVGGAFVERVEGEYFNVMGLPMHSLARHLRELIEAKRL